MKGLVLLLLVLVLLLLVGDSVCVVGWGVKPIGPIKLLPPPAPLFVNGAPLPFSPPFPDL